MRVWLLKLGVLAGLLWLVAQPAPIFARCRFCGRRYFVGSWYTHLHTERFHPGVGVMVTPR